MQHVETPVLQQADYSPVCAQSLEKLKHIMYVQRGIDKLAEGATAKGMSFLESGLDATALYCSNTMAAPDVRVKTLSALCVGGTQLLKGLIKQTNTDVITANISPDAIINTLAVCEDYYVNRLNEFQAIDRAPVIAEVQRFEKRLTEMNWDNNILGKKLDSTKYIKPFKSLVEVHQADYHNAMKQSIAILEPAQPIHPKHANKFGEQVTTLAHKIEKIGRQVNENNLHQAELIAAVQDISRDLKQYATDNNKVIDLELKGDVDTLLGASEISTLKETFKSIGMDIQLDLDKLSPSQQAYFKEAAAQIKHAQLQDTKAMFNDIASLGQSLVSIGQLSGSQNLAKIGAGISAAAQIGSSIATLASGAAVAGPIGAIAAGCFVIYSLLAKKKSGDGIGQALQSIYKKIEIFHDEVKQLFNVCFSNQKLIIQNQKLIVDNQQAILKNLGTIMEAISVSHTELSKMVTLSRGLVTFGQAIIRKNQRQLQTTVDRIYRTIHDNHNDIHHLVLSLFPYMNDIQEAVIREFYNSNLKSILKWYERSSALTLAFEQDNRITYETYRDGLIKLQVAIQQLESNGSLSGYIDAPINDDNRWNEVLPFMNSPEDLHLVPLRAFKKYLVSRFNLDIPEGDLVNMPLWYAGLHTYLNMVQSYRVGRGDIQAYGVTEKHNELFRIGNRIKDFSKGIIDLPEGNQIQQLFMDSSLIEQLNTLMSEQSQHFYDNEELRFKERCLAIIDELTERVDGELLTPLVAKENTEGRLAHCSVKVNRGTYFVEKYTPIIPSETSVYANYPSNYEKRVTNAINRYSKDIEAIIRSDKNGRASNLISSRFNPSFIMKEGCYIAYYDVQYRNRIKVTGNEAADFYTFDRIFNLDLDTDMKELSKMSLEFFVFLNWSVPVGLPYPVRGNSYLDEIRKFLRNSNVAKSLISADATSTRESTLRQAIRHKLSEWRNDYQEHDNHYTFDGNIPMNISHVKGLADHSTDAFCYPQYPTVASISTSSSKTLFIPRALFLNLLQLQVPANQEIIGYYLYAERIKLGNLKFHYDINIDTKQLIINTEFHTLNQVIPVATSVFVIDTLNPYQTVEESILVYWYGALNLDKHCILDDNFNHKSEYLIHEVHLKMHELQLRPQTSIEMKLPNDVFVQPVMPAFLEALHAAHLTWHSQRLLYIHHHLSLPSSAVLPVLNRLDIRFKLIQMVVGLTNSFNEDNNFLFTHVLCNPQSTLTELLTGNQNYLLNSGGYLLFLRLLSEKINDLPINESIPNTVLRVTAANQQICDMFSNWSTIINADGELYSAFNAALEEISSRIACLEAWHQDQRLLTHSLSRSKASVPIEMNGKLKQVLNHLRMIRDGKVFFHYTGAANNQITPILQKLDDLFMKSSRLLDEGEYIRAIKAIRSIIFQYELISSTDPRVANWPALSTITTKLDKYDRELRPHSTALTQMWHGNEASKNNAAAQPKLKRHFH